LNSRLGLSVAAAALAVALAPPPVDAKGCQNSLPYNSSTFCDKRAKNCPFQPPPNGLWGELEPVSVINNTTYYDGTIRVDSGAVLWTDLDIEGNRLVASWFGGLRSYSLTNPASPTLEFTVDGFNGAFAQWVPPITEIAQVFYGVSIPDGDPSFAVVAGVSPGGVGIVDLDANGLVRYQDSDPFAYQVWAAKIGNVSYAFSANTSFGVQIYNLSATRSAGLNKCLQGDTCSSGVRLGQIPGVAHYIHGLQSGGRTFIARSSGYYNPANVDIWEVTNPLSPVKLAGSNLGATGIADLNGVALWEEAGTYYLAVRRADRVEILNVSCAMNGTCSSLPTTAISSMSLPVVQESAQWRPLTFSRSGSTPFLFAGTFDNCREYPEQGVSGADDPRTPVNVGYEKLLDVSNPSVPRDVSPRQQLNFTSYTDNTAQSKTKSLDYWGWYNGDYFWGWANIAPRAARFKGEYLYRAAYTIGDIHRWTTPGPPTANFSFSPNQVYPGDPVTFTDTSTGSVTSRSWTFQDGTPAASTAAQQNVTFASFGNKSVTLVASNGSGSDDVTKQVTVIDPSPQVSGISVSPASPKVCQQLTLTAASTGRPTLTHGWTVPNPGVQTDPLSQTDNTFSWNTAGLAANTPHNVSVNVTGTGSPAGTSLEVVLGALDPLPGAIVATNDPFTNAVVQFRVSAPGATQWRWDFGDGAGFGPWSFDPVTGPNPTYSYTTVGVRNVRVQVTNCLDGSPVLESPPLVVNITQIEPLAITSFAAQGCAFGTCFFARGTPVTFAQTFTGGPTNYEYDWDGDGTFEQASASPVTSKVYTVNGIYTPRLRISRGAQSETAVHGQQVVISDPQPPSIGVSGPSSGNVNTSYTFSANGQNCNGTVTEAGWSWTAAGGGTVTGSGSTVTISWPTGGTKTVTARHSAACGSASGTKSITIGSSSSLSISGPSSGALNADLQFTATASGCTPSSSYSWSVGSGGSIQGSATGATITVRYSSSGNKTLTVTNSGCSGASGTKSVNIGSGNTSSSCGTQGNGLTACFSYTPAAPNAGQVVSFDGSSTKGNPTVYSWEFGSQGASAVGQQVTHTYAAAGSYNVRLSVFTCLNPGCEATHTRTVVVSGATLPSPSFTSSASCPPPGPLICSAPAGQPISFLDTSTGGVTSRLWSFGDGATSTASSVTHTYASGGTYPMSLTVTNASGSASAGATFVITGSVTAPVASFFTEPSCAGSTCSVLAGQAVKFTDNSTGFVSERTWTFGDGGTASTQQATHTWANSGSYPVVLTVSNSAGSSSATKTYNVSGPPQARIITDAACFWTGSAIECKVWRDEPVSFQDNSVGEVTSRMWNFGGGNTANGATATHTFTNEGTFPVALTVGNSYGSDTETYQFVVTARAPVVLLETDAACVGSACSATTGQEIGFRDRSKGRVNSRLWEFGDGGTATAQDVTRAYTRQGNFVLKLTVSNDKGSASTSRTMTVRNSVPKAVASFGVDTSCGGGTCSALVGQELRFTDTSTGAVEQRSWDFGDGETATGQQVTHAYAEEGTFDVVLAVTNAGGTSTASREIEVTELPPVVTVLLPWIAQTAGALDQSSDLSIFNPREEAVDVKLEFRRRGAPEANPPRADVSILPNETFRVGDALEELFDLPNDSGFLRIEVSSADGAEAPVVGSFNQTFSRGGESFGQAVPAQLLTPWPSGANVVQGLIGMNDNTDRLAYFGLTNPGDGTAVYRLRLFDPAGNPLGNPTGNMTVSRYGQKQFLKNELRQLFGTEGKTDFRIQVEQVSGPLLSVWGANLRLGSEDPSFFLASPAQSADVHVLGVLRTPGPNGSQWTSDLVLANPGAAAITVELAYSNVGAAGYLQAPGGPLTLAPGESRRLTDVLSLWSLQNAVGVVRVRPAGGEVLVQAETYDTLRAQRDSYGQAMPALTPALAGDAGDRVALVGLSQESGQSRSTLWVFNPGSTPARIHLRYRKLDGSLLGTIENFALAPGQARQINPGQHPLIGGSQPGGFTVDIEVAAGKLLAAAQVVNEVTNDPSYILGQAR
jgi:PKD repeat protein